MPEIARMEEQLRQQQEKIVELNKELQDQMAEMNALLTRRKCVDDGEDLYKRLRGNSDKNALYTFQDMLERCPDIDYRHYRLGVAFEENGRIPDAIKEFETTLQLNPKFAAARKRLEGLFKTNPVQ